MKVYQTKKVAIAIDSLLEASSPYEALQTGRLLIKGWVETCNDNERLASGRSFIYQLIKAYWHKFYPTTHALPKLSEDFNAHHLNTTLTALADCLGNTASKLNAIEASYLIGAIYTATLPEKMRSEKGVYFTPPSLTNRLLNLVELQGVQWNTSSVLDPACGGGAFLAPVALRIASTLNDNSPENILRHIETHLKGYEIDYFAAWLSQVFVEVALSKYVLLGKRRLSSLIDVCDTLVHETDQCFDVVIGNPPYGKIKLTNNLRTTFKESLYGHANLYGLFTHIALNSINKGGVIAYVTPTSFLAGEYFKNLRKLLMQQTCPKAFDFVVFRKGVFEDVLQETMLAVYQHIPAVKPTVSVSQIHPEPQKPLEVTPLGNFSLPSETSAPWIVPRTTKQSNVVNAISRMNTTLKDWGYEVKTGPLVWNRHKSQLSDDKGKNTYPLIWAESISADGVFQWKADKQNHTLYFTYQEGDNWLLTNYPCVLLQRTTAKEQQRRLIASLLPEAFIKKHKGVVIENHINIVKAINGKSPAVSLELLHLFLNSAAADIAFRCISGSVAVSAYELEAMPLPTIAAMKKLESLVGDGMERKKIEEALLKLYC